MSEFDQALEEARGILNRGAFQDAFDRIVDVPVNRPEELFAKIHVMTDAGIALLDVSILEYGLYLLEHHAREILDVPSFSVYYWLNLGNLRCTLLALREAGGEKRCYYRRSETVPVRKAYMKALECAGDNSELKARILCAHARLLTGLGRDWEAFGMFHKASLLSPLDAEALLGRAETLAAVAGTAPALEDDLCREALEILDDLLASEAKLPRSESARLLAGQLRERLGENCGPPDYPRGTVFSGSDREHEMIMFSLKHHLFLSPYAVCVKCDRAVGDAAALGLRHASLGTLSGGRYRKMAVLTGRITERYRVLRAALIDHHLGTPLADGADFQPHFPEVEGWEPLPAASSAFAAALAGTPALIEGMAACIEAYLGRDGRDGHDGRGSGRMESLMGTPDAPGAALLSAENPALHAFWDVWADGMEGLVEGVPLMSLFSGSLSSDVVTRMSLDAAMLTSQGTALLGWLRNLTGYLIRMADRDGRGDISDAPLWPLQPVILPGK